DRLARRHQIPLGELVVGDQHGPGADRRELVVKPPVRLGHAEVEQDRVVQLGQRYDAGGHLVAPGRRSAAAAEHVQAPVLARAEMRLAGGGDERLDVSDAAGGVGAHERVRDGLAGPSQLSVIVLEPADDYVRDAHVQAASGRVEPSSWAPAQRSTATSAWATTWSMFRYW